MKFKLHTYYVFHHSEKDTFQKLNIKELPLVPHGLLLDIQFFPGISPP